MSGRASGTLRVLMTHLVDYAGLFPPAALPMDAAAAAYAGYRCSPDAWALGRFVVPIARLRELAAAAPARQANEPPWLLSVLAGADFAADARLLEDFSRDHEAHFTVDTVEARAAEPGRMEEAVHVFPGRTVYAELPLAHDPLPMLRRARETGARAKMRTGGVTPDDIPTAAQVARFLAACAEVDVAFKATAGLHHPVCGSYPLTYAPDAPCAPMFGFVNVFVAAALARAGASVAVVERALGDDDAHAFHFGEDAVRWDAQTVSRHELQTVRAEQAISFGSCSFREPIDGIEALYPT